ncbi:uncharacterized protein LOC111906258 [Lactuca sativa]|uniref:Uncharacterized protein n=1 Tax=Lactuca sativa TaxID=4236 RepID=A0A9R1WWL2_LACSA|nr:uncharacterized protein LOC111906258 [Lactuca sativa]KAJ0189249.1 hypothetical protein LSAT_V11C800448230 [Lactuca sativa]
MVVYEELQYVGFVQLIELKALALLTNIYDFFKDNSGFLKSAVVSVESIVISPLQLINEKLIILCDYKLSFIDDKFEKYAPDFIKNLLGGLNSYIKEHISSVEEFFGTLIQKARTIVENGLSSIESLIQKCIDAKKAIFEKLVKRTESILENGLDYAKQALDKIKIVVGGIPIIGDATQSFITNQIEKVTQWIETTTSYIKQYGIFGTITTTVNQVVKETEEITASIIEKGTESASQVIYITISVVGGIPIIGDTAQSVLTSQTDMATQLINATTSSIKENGIVGTITSAVEQVASEAQQTTASIIQKGTESVNQVLDTTISAVGGIPIIGDAAQSILTSQTDMASQLIDATTSSVKENGIYGTITSVTTSVTQNVINGAQSTTESITESVSQALDTTASAIGSIPIIGEAAQSIITSQTDSVKENGIFGAITSATQNVISGAQSTTESIIQKGTESASQALDTTKSVIGSIPIIGDVAQSIITTPTDMASQLIDTTTSSVKENGILGAITSATQNVISGAQSTTESIIQKGTDSAGQALGSTRYFIIGFPIIGDAADSIITKQTDMANQLIDSTTSSVKQNGIFGAITSAAGRVVNEAQATGTSIIQKGTESASQALDTTKSVVGSIPIIGDTAQSIITKQTDMANQLIDTTTSSVKENGIFGAITSLTQNVGGSIIQMGSDSASQALETTKSVVGGIPIVGNAAESIITTQTDMASDAVESSTSSVKKHGLLGAILSAAGQVVEDVGNTANKIIEKGSDSVEKTLEKTTSSIGDIPILGSIFGKKK